MLCTLCAASCAAQVPHVQRKLRMLAYMMDAVWAEQGRTERLSCLPCARTQLSAEVARQVGRVLLLAGLSNGWTALLISQ